MVGRQDDTGFYGRWVTSKIRGRGKLVEAEGNGSKVKDLSWL